jgi:nicotinamidase-related amidase
VSQALVVVDMINDFVHGRPPSLPATPQKERVIGGCERAIAVAREADVPIIYTNDHFEAREMPTTVEYKVWGEHAIAGTAGAEIIDQLKPTTSDFIIPKKRYSAFPGTQLDLLLRELSVREIVVIGIQTDCCVQHTVWDGFVRTFATSVLEDACDAPDFSEHQRALRYMQTYYKTRVIDIAQWQQSLLGTDAEDPQSDV